MRELDGNVSKLNERGNIQSLYLQQKDTSSHGPTVYRTVPYAHVYEYASMRRHSPHILASDKDMYVALTVIVLKYSRHSLPKAQEKTLTAIRCTPNMTRSSKPMSSFINLGSSSFLPHLSPCCHPPSSGRLILLSMLGHPIFLVLATGSMLL